MLTVLYNCSALGQPMIAESYKYLI